MNKGLPKVYVNVIKVQNMRKEANIYVWKN